MMSLLVGWKGYAAAFLVGAILVGGAVWKAQSWRYEAQIAGMQRDRAQDLAEAQIQARAVEGQRTAAIEKVQDDAQKQIVAARADVAASDVAAGRLRDELKKLRARETTRHTAAATSGQDQSDPDPIGVLIDVLERMDGTGRAISQYADRTQIAGMACERAYDSLRK